MCLGVCYKHAEKIIITHFTDAIAKLPIYTKQGIKLITWGRHKNEVGELPFGGWLAETELKEGKWDGYFPKRIKIIADKFLQQDFEGLQRWFDITSGQALEGVYLQRLEERRVYIVTITPVLPDTIFFNWPKIIKTLTTQK